MARVFFKQNKLNEFKVPPTSENSNAALSTNSFSDQTLDLGPISLSANQNADIVKLLRSHDDITEQVRKTYLLSRAPTTIAIR